MALSRLLCAFALLSPLVRAADVRIGLIGTDTSHVISFAKLLNDPQAPGHVPGARITAAFKAFSPDVEASRTRVDKFSKQLADEFGVRFYPTMEDVARNCDALLIMNVDGRPHLPEVRRLLPFHRPMFIDKPLAADLKDAIEILRITQEAGVPCFSASDERFTSEMADLKSPRLGRQLGVFAYGPAELEPHHTDLYWYGIHAVEKMYTLMGTGCVSVVRTHTEDADIVTGVWSDGRTGTVRGNRNTRHDYGVIEFGTKAILQGSPKPGYGNLVSAIVTFFQTGKSPVPAKETIELLAFMTAADVSRAQGGVPVKIADVLRQNGGTP